MPPRLTLTNGPARRRLLRWMASAISSLPVPLSPMMSTDASSRRHAADHLQHLAQPRVLADQVAEVERGVEVLRARAPARSDGGVADSAERGAHGSARICSLAHGLTMKSRGAGLHAAHGQVDRSHAVISTTGSVSDAPRGPRQLLMPSSPRWSAGRSSDVLQDQLASIRREPRQRVGRPRHRVRRVAGLLQQQGQRHDGAPDGSSCGYV